MKNYRSIVIIIVVIKTGGSLWFYHVLNTRIKRGAALCIGKKIIGVLTAAAALNAIVIGGIAVIEIGRIYIVNSSVVYLGAWIAKVIESCITARNAPAHSYGETGIQPAKFIVRKRTCITDITFYPAAADQFSINVINVRIDL